MLNYRVRGGTELVFEDHGTTRFCVTFYRTLRVPDDGNGYVLPPGMGPFPIRLLADYRDRVPPSWRDKPGVLIPMYRREALWMSFEREHAHPNAVKIGAGMINAVSGKPWRRELSLPARPSRVKRFLGDQVAQDYLVCPPQAFFDGFNTGHGTVRQFVAVPLGSGHTVEGQLTGREQHGGIQLLVYQPRPGRFQQPALPPARDDAEPVKRRETPMLSQPPDGTFTEEPPVSDPAVQRTLQAPVIEPAARPDLMDTLEADDFSATLVSAEVAEFAEQVDDDGIMGAATEVAAEVAPESEARSVNPFDSTLVRSVPPAPSQVRARGLSEPPSPLRYSKQPPSRMPPPSASPKPPPPAMSPPPPPAMSPPPSPAMSPRSPMPGSMPQPPGAPPQAFGAAPGMGNVSAMSASLESRSVAARPHIAIQPMGLAAGGQISQKIYPDPYGIDAWDQTNVGEVFVYLVDSTMWRRITGENPPPCPIRRDSYEAMGFGWIPMFDDDLGDIDPSAALAGVKPLSRLDPDAD